MNLVKQFNQYNNNNVVFCEPIKNNIMIDGNFIRILYSNENMTLNGIYLFVNLKDIFFEKYYNKYKCIFNISKHIDIIDNLKLIEEDILNKYKTDKIPLFKIYEQTKLGYIKFFSVFNNFKPCSFVLKISGIWETLYNYGLTYKFIVVNPSVE